MNASDTYDLSFFHDDGMGGDTPDEVYVTITREDVEKWLELARYVKAEGLRRIEKDDNRCTFMFDGDALGDPECANVDFVPCSMRLVVMSNSVIFCGIEKHSGHSWGTTELILSILADDFGIER